MTKLLQLTNNSWILRTKTGTNGLLFFDEEKYVFMNTQVRNEFPTLDDVEKKFGKLTVEERSIEEDENSTIDGYPVKHLGVNVLSENPPTYKIGNNKTVYVAGYWGIKFANGWSPAFCPKQSTVESNESTGPFRNRLEMLNRLSNLNTADALKDNK